MNPAIILSYFAIGATFIVGLLLLVGYIGENFDNTLRITFGVIFIAYSVYRLTNIRTKLRIQKNEQMREKIREEKEKLLHGNEKN